MYDIATVFMIILALAGVVCVTIHYTRRYYNLAPVREKQKLNQRLFAAPTIHDPDEMDAKESNKATLDALGMPTVNAGRIIRNIPSINPDEEGALTQDLEVLTSSRIHALSPTGPKNIDFFELAKDYALFIKGAKVFVLQEDRLTEREEKYLSDQRISLIKTKDNVIEDFEGHAWNIKGAMGDFNGEDSTIQLLTVNPRAGEAGMVSVFPPELFDCRPHKYLDLEAINVDTNQVMVAIYTADSWCCFIGRQLSPTEIATLKGI